MEVVVTDHHQPAEQLPDCPILHPEVSGYPFKALCGTAVAWKLASALREDEATEHLDLVALATVADVVPLIGENRSLVRRGLAEVRRAKRPGMRALLAAAKCEPERLDETDLSFRLAPRINAAGRLYRADAGVELFLTEDEQRAEAIAESSAAPTPSAGRPSARSTRPPRRRCASCLRICARPTASSSPARTGIPAWSGSSPRGWSSATIGRPSSSRSTKTAAGAARAGASPASTCSGPWRRAASTSRASAVIAPPPGCRSGRRTSRPSARHLPRTPTRC